jgi:hypothetical protein
MVRMLARSIDTLQRVPCALLGVFLRRFNHVAAKRLQWMCSVRVFVLTYDFCSD